VVDGLGQVVERAQLGRTHGVAHLAVRGEHDDGQGRPAFAQARQHLEAIDVRQPEIEEHQVDRIVLGAREAADAIVGEQNFEVLRREHRLQEPSAGLVVFDHEQRAHGVCAMVSTP
jgi:hypothetical protein